MWCCCRANPVFTARRFVKFPGRRFSPSSLGLRRRAEHGLPTAQTCTTWAETSRAGASTSCPAIPTVARAPRVNLRKSTSKTGVFADFSTSADGDSGGRGRTTRVPGGLGNTNEVSLTRIACVRCKTHRRCPTASTSSRAISARSARPGDQILGARRLRDARTVPARPAKARRCRRVDGRPERDPPVPDASGGRLVPKSTGTLRERTPQPSCVSRPFGGDSSKRPMKSARFGRISRSSGPTASTSLAFAVVVRRLGCVCEVSGA